MFLNPFKRLFSKRRYINVTIFENRFILQIFFVCFVFVAECSFEEADLCGWSNIGGDNFDWTRDNAGTSSLGTGPRIDHTYGTAAGMLNLYIDIIS